MDFYTLNLTMEKRYLLLKIKTAMKKIISILLTLLGFSIVSCYQTKYGIMETNFQLKGKVSEKSNPIGNIRITVKNDSSLPDTLYTSQTGYFENEYAVYDPVNTFEIIAEDMDGENNNGIFVGQSKLIKLTEFDFNKGKGNWYEAIANKEVTFILKKQ